MGRRKIIILVNDASRYNVILYGLKAKELKNIKELIISAIRQTLLSDGVNPEMIDAYLKMQERSCFLKHKTGLRWPD
ncbi:DUF6933 domain-containing protein [Aminipila butyrica]|uniref:DUF6933 domain-containing protein n=1 Tax=Aminipila butyrica TaxID=433296 RepID=UPI0038B87ED1